jgi:hypothetical protein
VKQVFADTLYWIAIFLPGDPWASTAMAVDLSGASLITTEEVLSEFLTAVSAQAERTRCLACRLVREILTDPAMKGRSCRNRPTALRSERVIETF